MKILDRLRKALRGVEVESGASGSMAKERLRLVLAHDRSKISPGLLDMLKDEIIGVISSHLTIDADGVQVTVSQDSRESRLVADIPLITDRGKPKAE